ncbi:hypothetical protein N799_13570 [Lysobacter arseniciresistens ZS79]|uniref:Secreted protein n=1 Tax=Lysobacter arseniciresistens ZS79 TaxID=913325 RepID=A0A0A0ETW1_9GAMM|nr:hypothetical protein [Lysobacter arseniciresistens]KGM53954.1 hypothetical protein N799_13570 [Lysobacter arseniciresistens ZS79]
MRRALLLLMLAMPAAQAAECELPLGHGWPPATENHGVAVEGLLAADVQPALQLTWLPVRGVESALMLLPSADGGAWTLRHALAVERVDHRESIAGGSRRVLRVEQPPEIHEVPMPASLASRLVDRWTRTLQTGVAADRAARFHDGDLLSFVVDGARYSGVEPGCGPGEVVVEQAEALIDAAGEGDPDDLPERWDDLWRSLDELDEVLAGA